MVCCSVECAIIAITAITTTNGQTCCHPLFCVCGVDGLQWRPYWLNVGPMRSSKADNIWRALRYVLQDLSQEIKKSFAQKYVRRESGESCPIEECCWTDNTDSTDSQVLPLLALTSIILFWLFWRTLRFGALLLRPKIRTLFTGFAETAQTFATVVASGHRLPLESARKWCLSVEVEVPALAVCRPLTQVFLVGHPSVLLGV